MVRAAWWCLTHLGVGRPWGSEQLDSGPLCFPAQRFTPVQKPPKPMPLAVFPTASLTERPEKPQCCPGTYRTPEVHGLKHRSHKGIPYPPTRPLQRTFGAGGRPEALPEETKGVEIKRRVEEVGMRVAMEHGRREGRTPQDVSKEFYAGTTFSPWFVIRFRVCLSFRAFAKR